jgi:acylphosphatase
VEIIAEGERDPLEALIGAVRQGPPGAVVRNLQVAWEDAPAHEREFLVR